jgi:imidazolonepropionase-like amidohydrolase
MPSTRTLLANAVLVPCTGEAPFAGDLLVEGDRITGVFAGPAPVDPASVETVDLAGATVLPGLCDAHTHISWPLDFVFDHPAITAMADDEHALEVAGVVREYLASGYTTLVGAGALKPRVDVLVAAAIERGLIDGPRLWPSGEMLTQRGTIGAGNLREVDGAEEVRRAVGEQCALGVRSVKMMVSGDGIVAANPSQDTYMDDAMVGAAVDEAGRNGAFVTVHARSPGSVRMAVRNGVRIVHHATYLDDVAHAELVAARDDVWVCPGLHYLRQMVEGHAAPYGITAEAIERARYPDELRASVEGLRSLHDSGVRLVAGGDFGHQWTRHGTYAAELVSYVELLGLTPAEALVTATANAGPLVGEPLGRLEAGLLADLVVLDGDPTADVRVLLDRPRIRGVVKGGRPVGGGGWAGIGAGTATG